MAVLKWISLAMGCVSLLGGLFVIGYVFVEVWKIDVIGGIALGSVLLAIIARVLYRFAWR